MITLHCFGGLWGCYWSQGLLRSSCVQQTYRDAVPAYRIVETTTHCAVQALRDLQPLLQSPQVGLAAKAALIHASGTAEDHDKEFAVMNMVTELDVSNLPCCSCSTLSCCLSDALLLLLKQFSASSGTEPCCTALSSPAAGNILVAHWFPRAC